MARFLIKYVLVFFMCGLVGCTKLGPNFKSPDSPNVSSFIKNSKDTTLQSDTQGGEEQKLYFGKKLSLDWWKLFNCPQLNILIEMLIQKNQTLEAAKAAVLQAQENVRAASGDSLFPNVDFSAGINREKYSSFLTGTGSSSTYNSYTPALNTSYTVDLFGGADRNIEGLLALANYQEFLWENTCLNLTTTLVSTVITEASLREQIETIRDIVKNQQSVLDVIMSQFSEKKVSQAVILAQKTLLADTESLLPDLEKQLARTRHVLFVLIGEFPENISCPTFTFKDIILPQEIPISLPSTLVRIRPDIRASEELLHQASANIGVSMANQFPQLTISGMVGANTNSTNTIVANSGTVWSLGASLFQPIFNGGSLAAQVKANEAAYTQAFALYRQTVLGAFQDMADALRAIEIDAINLNLKYDTEKTALEFLDVTQKQFSLGKEPYLLVLQAQEQYLKTKLNLIQARTLRYLDTVSLFQALGGGWNKDEGDTMEKPHASN